jgi:hypothetical protein
MFLIDIFKTVNIFIYGTVQAGEGGGGKGYDLPPPPPTNLTQPILT